MDSVARAAPYFRDPVVLVGVVMLVVVLTARQLLKAGVIRAFPGSSAFRALKFSHVLLLGLVIIGAGTYLKHLELRVGTSAKVAGQSANSGVPGEVEVDFGFVELNPGQATPIPSYRHGGNMVLYAGEELRFQTLADSKTPTVELRAGKDVQLLRGSEGKLKIAGPPNQALSAVMFAEGSRVSLPGGLPRLTQLSIATWHTPFI